IKAVGDLVSWRGFAVARVRRMNQICCDAHWKSKPVSPAVVKARFIFLTSPDRLRFGLAAGDEKLVPRCRWRQLGSQAGTGSVKIIRIGPMQQDRR
ncbi:hypothetical protein ACE04B_19555, partial [Rhizobium phaseoli]